MTCSIEGCHKPKVSRGWCSKHYTMWQRRGDPLYVKPRQKFERCEAPGCERKKISKNLCPTHYVKMKRTGTLERLNHTKDWGVKNGNARKKELSLLDSTPQPNRRGYLATNTVSAMRTVAIRRGIEWNLTDVEAYRFIIDNCLYCGKVSGWPLTRNGIDRVDSFKSYSFDNCVACCSICNTAKSNRSLEEFISWINDVHARISKN